MMHNDAEIDRFKIGLLALHIPEIDDLARSAGVL
jgi:hypothetical protein